MPYPLDHLRAFVDGVLQRDGHDLESVKSAASRATAQPEVENVPGAGGQSESAMLEAVISLHRPVFGISGDQVNPELTSNGLDPETSEMAKLVKDNASHINATLPSIGRIDLPGDENYPWAGTGWIIDSELGSDIIVTNAHVAELFAEVSRQGYDFKALPFMESRREAPIIDFRRESKDAQPRAFKVLDVIYIGTPNTLDVAFMRVARIGAAEQAAGRALARPLQLAPADPAAGLAVATIGYPGADPGPYDPETLLRIFGNVFETKRCAPGKIMGLDTRGVSHDCSSMPGSSGSALVDVVRGDIVGLHFQGVPFKSNHAVPVSVIRKLIKDQPWRNRTVADIQTATSSERTGSTLSSRARIHASDDLKQASILQEDDAVKFVVPLEITVRLGDSVQKDRGGHPAEAEIKPNSLEAAVSLAKQQLDAHPGIVGVRGTFLFNEAGQITNQKGIVIKVRPEASRNPADYGLKPRIGDFPVSIEMADLPSLAARLAPKVAAKPDDLEAPAKKQAYKRDISRPEFKLDPITDDMTVTLHVSPEAGWRVLSSFFEGDEDFDRITIGMYNFTAPHIIDAVRAAVKPHSHQMTLTLDRKTDDIGGGNKADDWPEEKVMKALQKDGGDRFKWTPASVSGPGRLFATSYHIKVAVLGSGESSKRFWLSSGNWASSNQAPFDDENHPLDSLTWSDVKSYDRDWHAVVKNEKLATIFHNHLAQDYVDCEALEGEESAAPATPDLIVPEDYFLEAPRAVKNYRAFAPKVLRKRITIQPVLTPDNYPQVVLPLIKSARKSVLFINQSFDIKDDEDQIPPHYRGLLDALLDRQQKIDDVRIIFRSGYGKERDIFRRAVEFGFDESRIRFYGTCHTKGIVVDNKRVLLGSQNWTGAGTQPNRDASLLIDDEEAAQYFTDIFEFDWKNVATDRVPPDHGPSRAARARSSDEEAALPAGFRVVPWGAWNGT